MKTISALLAGLWALAAFASTAAAQPAAADPLAQFDRKAALTKELGGTHLNITEGLPSSDWERDPKDPYPAWFVAHASLLKIYPPQAVAPFIESAGNYDLKLIASLQPGAKSLKTVLAAFQAAQRRAPRKVLWLIGPEGDFTPAGMTLAQSHGFEPITLGPLVLRCETAAVYALSVLSYELSG